MSVMASEISGVSIVCSTVCPVTDRTKHESYTSLAFVGGIHRWPVDSPTMGQYAKMFPFDDVIMRRVTATHETSIPSRQVPGSPVVICLSQWQEGAVQVLRYQLHIRNLLKHDTEGFAYIFDWLIASVSISCLERIKTYTCRIHKCHANAVHVYNWKHI